MKSIRTIYLQKHELVSVAPFCLLISPSGQEVQEVAPRLSLYVPGGNLTHLPESESLIYPFRHSDKRIFQKIRYQLI